MNLPQVKDDLVQFNEMVFLYNSALKEIKLRLEILRDEYKFTHQYDPMFDMKTRIKSIDSITAKLSKQGKDITIENIEQFVDDVAGVRICCNYSTDIYHLVDMIQCQKDVEILNMKDYMTDPRPDGYRGYHMIVAVPVHLSGRVRSVKVELQMRTTAQNAWAILADVVEHTYDDYIPDDLIKEVRECADILTAVDQRMIRIQDEVQQYKKERQQ